MGFIYDLPGEVTAEVLVASQAAAANVTGTGIVIRDYIGKLAVVMNAGAATAGTTPTLDVYLQSSPDSNTSNYTNANISFTQVTNVAGVQKASVDTALVGPYLRALAVVGGTNSPSFPVSLTVVGQKQITG